MHGIRCALSTSRTCLRVTRDELVALSIDRLSWFKNVLFVKPVFESFCVDSAGIVSFRQSEIHVRMLVIQSRDHIECFFLLNLRAASTSSFEGVGQDSCRRKTCFCKNFDEDQRSTRSGCHDKINRELMSNKSQSQRIAVTYD